MDELNVPPCEFDVLFGQGPDLVRHVGNQRYREIVAQYADLYDATRRNDRGAVAQMVIGIVADGGRVRFFRREGRRGPWRLATSDEITTTVMRCLRELRPRREEQRRREQEQLARETGGAELPVRLPPQPAPQPPGPMPLSSAPSPRVLSGAPTPPVLPAAPMMPSVNARSDIIQDITSREFASASLRYLGNLSRLNSDDLRQISFHAHQELHPDVVGCFFPNLPHPVSMHDLEWELQSLIFQSTTARIRSEIVHSISQVDIEGAARQYGDNLERFDDNDIQHISFHLHHTFDRDPINYYFQDMPLPVTVEEFRATRIRSEEDLQIEVDEAIAAIQRASLGDGNNNNGDDITNEHAPVGGSSLAGQNTRANENIQDALSLPGEVAQDVTYPGIYLEDAPSGPGQLNDMDFNLDIDNPPLDDLANGTQPLRRQSNPLSVNLFEAVLDDVDVGIADDTGMGIPDGMDPSAPGDGRSQRPPEHRSSINFDEDFEGEKLDETPDYEPIQLIDFADHLPIFDRVQLSFLYRGLQASRSGIAALQNAPVLAAPDPPQPQETVQAAPDPPRPNSPVLAVPDPPRLQETGAQQSRQRPDPPGRASGDCVLDEMVDQLNIDD